MAKLARYSFKKPSGRFVYRVEINRPPRVSENDEQLTGLIHGLEASDIEERFARGLRSNAHEFQYETPFPVPGAPDWKIVDFIVDIFQPITVYGEIGHNSQAEQEDDLDRLNQLNETFASQGYNEMLVVWWPKLVNQDIANQTVQDLFF